MASFDDDDFFLDDDELAQDNEIGLIGDAKLSLISKFGEILQNMERNVKFNEKGDYDANLEILSNYLGNLISLSELESQGNADFSNEELMQKIQEIINSTTVITMQNINSIIPEEPETVVKQDSSDDDPSGTDW